MHHQPNHSRVRGRSAALILLAALPQLASSCTATKPTQIVVSIATDLAVPGELDGLLIVVGQRGAVLREPIDLDLAAPGALALPATIALNAGRDPAEPVRIAVTGSKGGTAIVIREARMSFVPQRILLLPMNLLRSCAYRAPCPADQTCADGACVSIDVSAAALRDYTPQAAFARLDASPRDGAPEAGPGDGPAARDSTAPPDGPADQRTGTADRAAEGGAIDQGTGDGARDQRTGDGAPDQTLVDPRCAGLQQGSECTGGGGLCLNGLCVVDQCYIQDTTYAAGSSKPGNNCQACEPIKSFWQWTNVRDGTRCPDPALGPGSCWAGACCTGCWDPVTKGCVSGSIATACGKDGFTCKDCTQSPGAACVAGGCLS